MWMMMLGASRHNRKKENCLEVDSSGMSILRRIYLKTSPASPPRVEQGSFLGENTNP